MQCPVDGSTLQITDRQGVEIDYCPSCRGVWLDRGELDKIIDRSEDLFERDDRERRPPQQPYREQPSYREQPYREGYPKYGHKKRKGFLGDLFDFD